MDELNPSREVRDQRVAVMQDILERVAVKEYDLIVSNGYMKAKDNTGAWSRLQAVIEAGGDLQDHVDVVAANCEVCMRGAACLSLARLYDEVPVGKLAGGGEVGMSGPATYDVLRRVFDPFSILMMEAAFEAYTSYGAINEARWREYPGNDEAREKERRDFTEKAEGLNRAATAFGYKACYGGRGRAAARAEAVARHVIENDGVFNLEPMSQGDLYAVENAEREAYYARTGA